MWDDLNHHEMPDLEAIIAIENFELLYSATEQISSERAALDETFAKQFPEGLKPEDINYHEDTADELALINYTSGTSGFSKGVMLPYRSLTSNVLFALEAEPHMNNSSKVVSMLPTAHMYGLMFEFLFEMTVGAHVYFLTRLPSPKVILEALGEVKPDIIISVPLIIEKIYKNTLMPIISKNSIKLLLNLPIIDQVIKNKILKNLTDAFGCSFEEVIIGGAALNKEAEAFFRKIRFPFTVGYGMTECGPIITYAHWDKTCLYSCGKAAPRMELKIDSPDPANIAGEVLVKGDNVFLGYYKNEEATAASFTEDGWFRTGDMGVLDNDGFLYLRGRNKSMILGPSGQNIYPEEIEGIINNLPYVTESLVIEDNGQLTALIYPDFDTANKSGMSDEDLHASLQESVNLANIELPNYCKIAKFEVFPEEFEKTPKKSIKRYLYQR